MIYKDTKKVNSQFAGPRPSPDLEIWVLYRVTHSSFSGDKSRRMVRVKQMFLACKNVTRLQIWNTSVPFSHQHVKFSRAYLDNYHDRQYFILEQNNSSLLHLQLSTLSIEVNTTPAWWTVSSKWYGLKASGLCTKESARTTWGSGLTPYYSWSAGTSSKF